MAPFNAWPVLFLTFPTLVWLIDGAGVGRWGGVVAAAATGWWFGFGYFVAGLYWIGYAFLVDAPTFGWLMPFAVIGLPAVLAVYTALGVALARMLWTRGAMRILALARALTVTEWLRGHLFTGFPWNTFGYALTAPLPLAQSAARHRHLGPDLHRHRRSFASPATLTDDRARNAAAAGCRWRSDVAALAALGGYGAMRLARAPTRLVDGVHLRIMQPNLQQDVRFNYAAKQAGDEALHRAVRVAPPARSRRACSDVTHLIWPESPFPFFLTREADALAQIANLLPPKARC